MSYFVLGTHALRRILRRPGPDLHGLPLLQLEVLAGDDHRLAGFDLVLDGVDAQGPRQPEEAIPATAACQTSKAVAAGQLVAGIPWRITLRLVLGAASRKLQLIAMLPCLTGWQDLVPAIELGKMML